MSASIDPAELQWVVEVFKALDISLAHCKWWDRDEYRAALKTALKALGG